MKLEKPQDHRIEWGVRFELVPMENEPEPDEVTFRTVFINLVKESVPVEGEVHHGGQLYRYFLNLECRG